MTTATDGGPALTRFILCTLLVLSLAACQTRGPDWDPLEPVNRKIFWFNDTLDQWVLEPTARGWTAITNEDVRDAFNNAFQNLKFPIYFVGNMLNLRVEEAGRETVRFIVNTTVGVLGFWDRAAQWGLEPARRDLGMAFGGWGLGPGPPLQIPILGPSNPRDFTGDAGGWLLTPHYSYYLIVPVTDTVNRRALNLELIADMREDALDYYAAVRNAYYQYRQARVNDREPEDEEDGDDLYDLDEEDDLYDLPDEEEEDTP